MKLDAKAVAALTLPNGKSESVVWDSELPKILDSASGLVAGAY